MSRGVATSLLVAAGAVVAASAGPVGCNGSTEKTPVPDAGPPLTIGVTLALTGDLKGTGIPLQNAVRVAEQQINAYGGVLGRRVVFHVLDDTTDTGEVLRSRTQQLLDEGALAILGPIGSSQVKAVADSASAGPFNPFTRKVIQISGTATSPELSTMQPPTDRYFFRTVPNDNLQGKALAIFAAAGPPTTGDAGVSDSGPSDSGATDAGKLDGAADAQADAAPPPPPPPGAGCKNMALVHNDDSYGNPFAAAVTSEFTKRGGSVVIDVRIPTDAKDNYKTEVGSIVAAKPDCLAMIVYDPAGDQLARDIAARRAELPAKFFMMGTDGVYTSDFIVNGRTNKANPNDPTVVEGMYGTNPDPNPDDRQQYGDFKALYLAQFALDQGQTDLPGQAANFYDAALLAALAIQRAGATDPVKIRDALFEVSRPPGKTFSPGQLGDALQALRLGQDIDYAGASGDCDFDQNGDVIANYIIWQVQNGQFVTVKRITAQELQ